MRLFVLLEKSSYLHQVMYGTGEYRILKRKLAWLTRRWSRRSESGGSGGEGLRGKATLPWGNVHGLVSLVAIEGLPGGQEVERLVRQAV